MPWRCVSKHIFLTEYIRWHAHATCLCFKCFWNYQFTVGKKILKMSLSPQAFRLSGLFGFDFFYLNLRLVAVDLGFEIHNLLTSFESIRYLIVTPGRKPVCAPVTAWIPGRNNTCILCCMSRCQFRITNGPVAGLCIVNGHSLLLIAFISRS